jgi:hypothetical protein
MVVIDDLYFDSLMVDGWDAVVIIFILVHIIFYLHRVALVNVLLQLLLLGHSGNLASSLLAPTLIILLPVIHVFTNELGFFVQVCLWLGLPLLNLWLIVCIVE